MLVFGLFIMAYDFIGGSEGSSTCVFEIEFVVRDESTGHPIEGAVITATDSRLSMPRNWKTDRNGTARGGSKVDCVRWRSGLGFRQGINADLPEWSLSVAAPGYISSRPTLLQDMCPDGRRKLTGQDSIELLLPVTISRVTQ
jgi:hypothetical protein